MAVGNSTVVVEVVSAKASVGPTTMMSIEKRQVMNELGRITDLLNKIFRGLSYPRGASSLRELTKLVELNSPMVQLLFLFGKWAWRGDISSSILQGFIPINIVLPTRPWPFVRFIL
jgi:hypothetical protein